MVLNIYCDETTHLLNDRIPTMVLGALTCPKGEIPRVTRDILAIKAAHSIPASTEAKWTRVSPGQVTFYEHLLGYFFDEPCLDFRAVIIPDKSILRHAEFHQDHDDWYYKMYYVLLKALMRRSHFYHIYLDTKDTRSAAKIAKLHEVLANSHELDGAAVESVKSVRSHEVQLFQILDLLLGAVNYTNRKLSSSGAKTRLVDYVKERSGLTLEVNTSPTRRKVNILRWTPSRTSQ